MALTTETAMDETDWVAVNSVDISHLTLQLASGGPVIVAVAGVKPSVGSTTGILLVRNELEEIPLPGLVSGDKVWVRSKEAEANRVVSYQVPI